MAQPDVSAEVVAIEFANSINLAQATISGTSLLIGGVSITSGQTVILGAQSDSSDGIYSVAYAVDAPNNQLINVSWTFLDFVDPAVLLFVRVKLLAGTLFEVYFDKYGEEFELVSKPQIAIYPVSYRLIVQRDDSTLVSYTEVQKIHVTLKAQSPGWLHQLRRFIFPALHDLTDGNVELMEAAAGKTKAQNSEDFTRTADFEFELTAQLDRLSIPYTTQVLQTINVSGGFTP